MSLFDEVITEPCAGAPKGIIYADPGVGKTTFAAGAPDHIIMDIENGANHLRCNKTPYLQDWRQCVRWLKGLRDDEHPYKVVAIDTVDWLCTRLIDNVVSTETKEENGMVLQSIHRVHGGYGEGMARVRASFLRSVLPALDAMSQRGIAVILLAHTAKVSVMSSEGYSVEKTGPDLDKQLLPILTEWADFVALGAYKDGKRWLRMRGDDQIVAKSRYRVPPTIPMDWGSFVDAIKDSNNQARA